MYLNVFLLGSEYDKLNIFFACLGKDYSAKHVQNEDEKIFGHQR